MSLWEALGLLALLAAFLGVSHSAYLDEVSEEQWYIHDVCTGLHPDYLELEPDCD